MSDCSASLAPSRAARSGGWFRRAVESRLDGLDHGTLTLVADGGPRTFGRAVAGGLDARVVVRNARFFRSVALGGSIGAAESYMDGDWTTDDLPTLVRLLLRNQSVLGGVESGLARIGRAAALLRHLARRNTRAGSRRNIAEHYDLGNAFFERMLDPTMTYSSAVFPSAGATLEEASRHKIELLCRKLDLRPEDHLLEIGSGWGALAIHAASVHGCRVTTTTISREQHALASERVRAAGLGNRVTVLLEDYRDLAGRYDKLVSVEMIEAVGAEYYATFFGRCGSLLAPGGRMALQAITIADQAFDRHRRDSDFISRYVFPGSRIPSVTALLGAATRASDLRLRGLEDFSPHYARTLASWRANLAPHRAWVLARYGERFWRMWDYYLGYCEGAFSEGYVSSVQMTFEKPRWGVA